MVERDDSTVEEALSELQRVVREPGGTQIDPRAHWGGVPEDLATTDNQALYLEPAEERALAVLRRAVIDDLRFEHLKDNEIDTATWRFVCLASLQADENHVEAFMANNARELMQRRCFFPVIHLTVTEEIAIGDTTLIPKADAKLPDRILGPDPGETMASAIAVECTGSDYNKMSARAKTIAEHTLRVLRAGLREERFAPDEQLRFALGDSVWFDDGASGWGRPPTMGWDYEPGATAIRAAMSQPVAFLPVAGRNDVEDSANRALKWWEQGFLATDPLMELLFMFFALEAILGTKYGEKARPLALRRAILSYKRAEHFAHPLRVYGLYKDVRNAAVHGGQAPEVAKDELLAFSWDVRRALNEYLDFARADGLDRNGLLEALDNDPASARIEKEFLPEKR